MKLKQFYYLTDDFMHMPAGSKIRVHDWTNDKVQISLRGELVWIDLDTFLAYFKAEQ